MTNTIPRVFGTELRKRLIKFKEEGVKDSHMRSLMVVEYLEMFVSRLDQPLLRQYYFESLRGTPVFSPFYPEYNSRNEFPVSPLFFCKNPHSIEEIESAEETDGPQYTFEFLVGMKVMPRVTKQTGIFSI